MPAIDNNIIQSLGVGSGIDTNSIVKQLTDIERSGPQSRIDDVRDKTESQISDYGLLSSAMATLADAAKVLVEPEGLFSKSASYSESSALVPVELSTDVQTGSYEFEVSAIAKSQSITSGVFSDVTDTVGEGIMTIDFGTVTVDGVGDAEGTGAMTPAGFTIDESAVPLTITIDSNNNTLEGLRDAINDSDSNVQATIVNNGSGYILQINAESGASNEMRITVAEGGTAPEDIDADGLSRFAFNTDVSNMTQNQAGQDALITINGLEVSRESNNVDDIVDGLTLDVLKADPGAPITVTITDDKAFAEQNIRDFVDTYNTFLEAIKPAIGSYEEEDEDGKKTTVDGSLARDSLAKSVVSRIRSVISASIPGLTDTLFTSLGTSGIQTETDGTISIDEDKFKESLENNFEDLQKLFAPQTHSSDAGVKVNSYGENTVAGEYEVVITAQPRRSEYQGQIEAVPLDTTSSDHTFTVSVDGVESNSLTLPQAVYSSKSEIAGALQTLINADTNLTEAGASVLVTYDSINTRFNMTSATYGASSNAEVTASLGQSGSELGFTVAAAAVAGATVAGTINGVAGFGTANVLLPALGEPGESLAMIIGDNATTSTVSFSRGFSGELEGTLSEFLESNGLFDKRELALDDRLEKLDNDQSSLDRKMTIYQERLMNQFISMEKILNGLNSSGGFLENLIDTLPFTAEK